MSEFRTKKDVLVFSIMTLITVLTWIIFEVYRVATKTTIPKVTQEQMRSLDPKIRREVIDSLQNNIWFSTDEEFLNILPFQVSTESSQER